VRILILGGDGYLGWPTAMHLSNHGYDVFLADNYLRRRVSIEENVEPLSAVPNLEERAKIWNEVSGKNIKCYIGDLQDSKFMDKLFIDIEPEVIVHYAEQPSAPYSMLDQNTASLTLINNLKVTHNLIYAVKNYTPSAHIIKLGTMGEYGTPEIDIEEGWLDIEHKGRKDKFLYPRQAGSLYHTTKIMDTDMLWFYVRMWDLKVTDLMQGPVYGIHTDENEKDERLYPFFCYDELFGTVVNRFVVQAVAGRPLTVYGKGGQTRGYLNIKDTLNFIRLSVENPPETGELRIFNQFTETFSVNELAERIKEAGDELSLNVKVDAIQNPRKEKEEHYYNPAHTGLLELGLKPHPLTKEVLIGMMQYVIKHKEDIDIHKIFRGTHWK
jgi:UDP-sulfoquinovose synthase